MSESRTIRTVTLEFLRAGPPHNQLLSPLTQYLAVCGEAGATVVNVPWEHAQFLRRIEEMRYENGTDEDPARRLAVLEETGTEVARLLGAIPAVSGVLDGAPPDGEVLHLRLVLSASELGLIPYEASKIPSGLQLPAENWLLLQANTPVCLTRHVRSVPYGGVAWDRRPRVLFIASDPEELPFEEHRDAMVEAARPWLNPGQDKKPTARRLEDDHRAYFYGDVLTVMPDASLQNIRALCEQHIYTHVHVLAHGGVDDTTDKLSYGVGLRGEIVTGNAFASALTTSSSERIERPAVVTLACCDSANVGSVISAGASFAHSLHEAGVPMVVASQFPLSFEGSTTAVRRMYGQRDGFLWGHNPLFMLHELRRCLQITNEAHSHDWASVVVYEALPPDLDEQLIRYDHFQAERGLKAAEKHLPEVDNRSSYQTVLAQLTTARGACRTARRALPTHGPYAVEALALKAASYKKVAEVEFRLATKTRVGATKRDLHMDRCLRALDSSYECYRNAVADSMNPETESQLKAQPHYVCVQMLALGTILGKEEVKSGYWEVAQLSARAYARLPSDEERAWALGTLIELSLLGVADPSLGRHRSAQPYEREALGYARALVDLFPARGEFPVYSTYRQLRRYTHWWGERTFVEQLKRAGVVGSWDVGTACKRVAEVSREIQAILKPRLWESQV